jgi:hypothetical protein
MTVQLFPAVPVVLALIAVGLFAAVRSVRPAKHGFDLLLRSRARWADTNGFVPVNQVRAANRIQDALPGLPGSQNVSALNAFEKSGCLVLDVVVVPRSEEHAERGTPAWQAMTVARATIDHEFPLMEIRPWIAWPPDTRVVAQRDLGMSPDDGFSTGQAVTIETRDADFDRTFVVRGKNKRMMQKVLTPEVRRVFLECPLATYSMTPGAILITAPRIASDEELDHIVHVLLEGLRYALALRPYAA